MIFEIQTGSFSPLKRKLERLLESHRVVLVHPIAITRHIVKLPERVDEEATRRRSPKKGALVDVVDPLVSIPHLLEHPRFELEAVLIEEEELRRFDPSGVRRRGGWRVVGRRLVRVLEQHRFSVAADLLALLDTPLPDEFTTRDLADLLGTRRALAQKLAYCLRESGQIEICGKQGNALLYCQSREDCQSREVDS